MTKTNPTYLQMLHASENGDLETVETYMKKHPKDLDRAHPHGYTALFLAAAAGHEDIVQFLLDKDASPFAPKGHILAPSLIADQRGHHKIARMIDKVREEKETARLAKKSVAVKKKTKVAAPR